MGAGTTGTIGATGKPSSLKTTGEVAKPSEIEPWATLLVLQASPFCNINCDYCYLPNRTSTRRMSMQVLASAIEKTYASDLVRGELTIIWHAGEPLAVPISWYEEALATISVTAPTEANIVHSIQSNGTLLNQRWCDFIKSHDIRVGLSIDGPDFLHDLHRKTRRGDGSHRAAMRGLQLLKDNDIPFHVIAVITQRGSWTRAGNLRLLRDGRCRAPGLQYRRSRGGARCLHSLRQTRRTRAPVLSNDLRKSEEARKRSRISRLGSNDARRLARTTATAARALRLTGTTRTAPSRPHKPSIVAMRCKCRSI